MRLKNYMAVFFLIGFSFFLHGEDDKSFRMECFKGKEARKYVPELAKLRIQIFSEWPYLYEGDDKAEEKYLKKFYLVEGSCIALAFHGDQIIGAATGIPLKNEDKAVIEPFEKRGKEISEYFYFSEFVLKEDFRGKGLGHLLFDALEDHAKGLVGIKKICLCAVIRDSDDPRRPNDHFNLDYFWRRKGCEKQDDLVAYFSWKEHGYEKETKKPLVFWTKDL